MTFVDVKPCCYCIHFIVSQNVCKLGKMGGKSDLSCLVFEYDNKCTTFNKLRKSKSGFDGYIGLQAALVEKKN